MNSSGGRSEENRGAYYGQEYASDAWGFSLWGGYGYGMMVVGRGTHSQHHSTSPGLDKSV